MIQSMNKIEVFNKIKNILIDMGNPESKIDQKTNFETDLGFDYLDLADFLIRIENEFKVRFDINIVPNYKYPQFENLESTINYLLKINNESY